MILDGNVERGCLSSLDNATIAGCDTPTCQICRGSGCNAEVLIFSSIPYQSNNYNVFFISSFQLIV